MEWQAQAVVPRSPPSRQCPPAPRQLPQVVLSGGTGPVHRCYRQQAGLQSVVSCNCIRFAVHTCSLASLYPALHAHCPCSESCSAVTYMPVMGTCRQVLAINGLANCPMECCMFVPCCMQDLVTSLPPTSHCRCLCRGVCAALLGRVGWDVGCVTFCFFCVVHLGQFRWCAQPILCPAGPNINASCKLLCRSASGLVRAASSCSATAIDAPLCTTYWNVSEVR